ncbi:carbohydrate-binding protein [Planctomycetota bacterium]
MKQPTINQFTSGLILILMLSVTSARSAVVTLISDYHNSKVVFAVEDMKTALTLQGYDYAETPLSSLVSATGRIRIVIAALDDKGVKTALQDAGGTLPAGLKPEGFCIRMTTQRSVTIYWVLGADAAGTMYGGLELAEMISLDGMQAVKDVEQNPHLEARGLKLNIPLDCRTPSYADAGNAAQANIPEMWSWDFWTHHLDTLARHRYNAITLWSLHPFPSLVKVPDYPNVALDNVMRADDFDFGSYDYNLSGDNMYSKSIMDKAKIIKAISIDDKIKFWQDVMQYAHDRNVKFYLITWNVFTASAEDSGHGITNAQSNSTTKDYMRKCVRAAFATYPLLAGIGVTAGENMNGNAGKKEDWLWETYGLGMMDVANDPHYPDDRKFEFIHRYWWSDMGEIKSRFKFPSDVEFNFSHKYAQARLYQDTNPGHIGDLPDQLPDGSRFWLNLRNDDIMNFRWGDPDYVREFINQMPPVDKIKGFHMGSDGYVWGREHTSTEPESPRQLEIEKHWYRFMLWGRLGYDPTIPNSRFQKMIQKKFPGVDAAELIKVWSEASKIIAKVNRVDSPPWDFQWAVEYCRSRNSVKKDIGGSSEDGNELKGYASYVLERVNDLRSKGGKELRLTIGDVEAMAHLGNFYAVHMGGSPQDKAEHFRKYAAVASAQYGPQLLGRAGEGDWKKIYETWDSSAVSISTTPGGIILEAEDATLSRARVARSTVGATGSGYVDAGDGSSIEFSYDAPNAGEYLLEFRYTLEADKRSDQDISVNGMEASTINFWNTGGSDTWAWDRKVVNLNSGPNTIKLDIKTRTKVDHLNILYAGGGVVHSDK